MDVTTLELQRVVQREIQKFARLAGIPYDHPNPLSGFDWDATGWQDANAYAMARLSVLAYRDQSIVEEHLREAAVTQFAWFEDTATDTQGFGFTFGKAVILCFRGTESKRDAMIDAERHKIDFQIADRVVGKVHTGFKKAADAVRPQIEKFLDEESPDRRIWVTGHSLGGAIATLVTARIAHSRGPAKLGGMYTFGQPRVGNGRFKRELIEKLGGTKEARNKLFRIYRCADPVAMMPRFGYRHVTGDRCYIARDGGVVFGAQKRQRYLERAITWTMVVPRILTSGGRLMELQSLVSDHYSSGYLAKLRDNMTNKAAAKKDQPPSGEPLRK
jgi:triacylglycerol lipase